MDYRQIIESRYNRKNWQELLFDIFRNKAQFWQQPQRVTVDESMAKSAYYTGKITLPDGHTIAIYEVELSDSVVIERNRAGIRNLLCTNWRGMGCSGAFMFCFRQQEAVLRFSYVSEAFTFADDGSLKKDSTDTKRFTYLLGEGHRSRTAIQQFEKLKASGLTLKDITKAFSVEALSDLFFKEYKKQYEDIIEFVTGKRMVKVANKWEERITGEPCREIMQEFEQFENTEKAVRDYVKKLMGRLVFIQFLQKKGWMGCSAGEAWNDGDREFVQNLFANTTHKNTFIDEVLEPLFNDINTKRKDDLASDWSNFYLLPYGGRSGGGFKVPYLNGGLFEHDDYDKTAFPLPAKYMKSLLDFFASYNFTIDENDPDDAEIGVDPEMLGRIFENLLEDNKDKGAFYTPKEIVQYMCGESLIAYLQTDEEDEAVKLQIREFVTTNNAALLSADLAASIDQKLKDVKICDPAIGSGAFPMGLLRELYACRKAIEGIDDETAVRIKTEIIQNNIYGVDIEKGAVDIARLRFWLALIVDEKTPHALPNMDFKIMQGNSLLEQYEGVELSGMSLNEQEKRRSRKKKEQAWQQTLAFDEEASLDNIQNAIREYYGTDDHRQKTELRNIINSNVKSYILNLKGCTPDIQRKLENLPIPNDQFFLWHIYFKEVFDKGGFDIVIGNPPYIKERDNKDTFATLLKTEWGKRNHAGKMDYWFYFMHKAIEITTQTPVVCFITSRYWVNSSGAKKVIKDIKKNLSIRQIIDVGDLKLFDNVVGHHMISMYNSNDDCAPCLYRKLEDNAKNVILGKFAEEREIAQEDIICNNEIVLELRNKIDCNTKLSDFCIVSQGVVEASDKISSKMYRKLPHPNHYVGEGIFVLNTHELSSLTLTSAERQYIKPYLGDGCINRYYINYDGTKNLIYSDETCRNLIKNSNDFIGLRNHLDKFKDYITSCWKPYGIHRSRKVEYFTSKKIITPSMFAHPSFAYDENSIFVGMSFNVVLPLEGTNLLYILGILNSDLADKWFYANAKHRGVGVDVGVEKLREFPIPNVDKASQQLIINIVQKIIDTKKANPLADTTAEEREIDRLVYDLYPSL